MSEQYPEFHEGCGGRWIYGASKKDRGCDKCRLYQWTPAAVQLFEIDVSKLQEMLKTGHGDATQPDQLHL